MTLGKKIGLTLGTLVLAVLVVGIYAEIRLDTARQQARQTREAWRRLEPLIDLVAELRTYQRVVIEAVAEGAVDSDVAEIRESEARMQDSLGQLMEAAERRRNGDDEMWDVLAEEISENLVAECDRLVEASQQVLDSAEGPDRERRVNEFMELCGSVGSTLSVSARAAEQDMDSASETLREIEDEIEDVMIVWGIAFALLVVSLWVTMFRVTVHPVRSLLAGVSALRQRQFDHRVPVRTSDELGQVAESFNTMAQELESFYQSLEERVEAQTAEIRRTFAELERSQKLAGIGTLAAGVAHEINNPLEAITVSVEGLARQVEDGDRGDPSAMRERLTAIQGDIERCRVVTSQLLEFSRQRPVGAATQPERVDLVPILEGAAEFVPLSRRDGERRITCRVAERPLFVMGDPHRLHQVVLNLVMNSTEATEPGGAIRLSAQREGESARFAVSDDGVGIDHCDFPHLFEPFYTTKPGQQNSGLGLAVVHGIVSDHGGSIEAESKGPGRGATFIVTLPLARGE